MSVVRPFPNDHIESLAKVLGECGSGSEIS